MQGEAEKLLESLLVEHNRLAVHSRLLPCLAAGEDSVEPFHLTLQSGRGDESRS